MQHLQLEYRLVEVELVRLVQMKKEEMVQVHLLETLVLLVEAEELETG
jgi:hypothetical protein